MILLCLSRCSPPAALAGRHGYLASCLHYLPPEQAAPIQAALQTNGWDAEALDAPSKAALAVGASLKGEWRESGPCCWAVGGGGGGWGVGWVGAPSNPAATGCWVLATLLLVPLLMGAAGCWLLATSLLVPLLLLTGLPTTAAACNDSGVHPSSPHLALSTLPCAAAANGVDTLRNRKFTDANGREINGLQHKGGLG